MNFKRFLAFVLVMVMVFAYVPAGAFATEGAAPALPTAAVSSAEREGAAFAVSFKVDALTAEQLAYYGSWTADFVLTMNRDVTLNGLSPEGNSYISILCAEMGITDWFDLPAVETQIPAGTGWGVIDHLDMLMAEQGGATVTLEMLTSAVNGVAYAAMFHDAYLQANPDVAEQVEAQVREKLLANSAATRSPAKAADRPVAVSADDFNDED